MRIATAALLIALDPIDLKYACLRWGGLVCARCSRPRDARGPRGELRSCCKTCLADMKSYRVYGTSGSIV